MPDEDNPLQRLREFDERRPSVPGEHWVAFGAGVYFLTRQPSTALGRVAFLVVGTALIARALSGRDGAIARLRELYE